jgi:hypothetical protein
MARVDEVGDGIYRISTTVALGEGAFQFNQFLIDDERPTLIHTGLFPMYEDVRKRSGVGLQRGRSVAQSDAMGLFGSRAGV